MPVAFQRSFDDLGTPLREVTFCVIDLETTGGSAADGGITELGAVKLRGGECLGTFQTLVNPGRAIPPSITMLTGITEAMIMPAPRIESVLPTLLEFLGDAVFVGHNVRFDLGFLQAALRRSQRPPRRRLPSRRRWPGSGASTTSAPRCTRSRSASSTSRRRAARPTATSSPRSGR